MFFFNETVSVHFLRALDLNRTSGWIYNSYRNSYWTLSIRTKGETNFFIDGNTINVKSGEVLLIPPNLIYSQYTEGEQLFAIHFDTFKYINAETLQKQTVKDWDNVCRLFKEIYTIYTEKPKGWHYKTSSLLYELLCIIHTESEWSAPEISDHIDSAVEYLEKFYTDPSITVAELARISGYSEAYFRRIFSKRFGITPSQRIDNLRLERAKRLLESREHTMAEVADRIGIPDPKYFSTWFKKHMGLSPREYSDRLVG